MLPPPRYRLRPRFHSGSEVVDTVRVLPVWVGFEVPLVLARTAASSEERGRAKQETYSPFLHGGSSSY